MIGLFVELVVMTIEIILLIMFTFGINIINIYVTDYFGYLFIKFITFIILLFLTIIQILLNHFISQQLFLSHKSDCLVD